MVLADFAFFAWFDIVSNTLQCETTRALIASSVLELRLNIFRYRAYFTFELRVFSSISISMYTVRIRHSSCAGLFHWPFIQAVIRSLTARLDMWRKWRLIRKRSR